MSLQLASMVLAELRGRAETLATAESLTRGQHGGLFNEVPGASDSYVGGVISYATRLKATLAGVDPVTLQNLGPVAEETAQQMASGVSRVCGADWGLATTGVAGPTPQDGHPVGEVYVAVAHPASRRVQAKRLSLSGDRATIREAAVAHAVQLLADALETMREPAGSVPEDS